MAFVAALSVLSALPVFALPVSHYAQSSVLSSGKWAKIRVENTGMQFLSNAQLKNLGFTNPSKVNVYGYGGRMISEVLDSKQIDDLPLLPCVRTEKGIVFFGVNSVDWTASSSSKMKYRHINHAYEDASYYFLSDREVDVKDMEEYGRVELTGSPVTTFVERIAYEKDLSCPTYTGRLMAGEDFRTVTARSFPFRLPDNVGGDARIKIGYVARTTGGNAVFKASVNGKKLGSDCSVPDATNNTYLISKAVYYTLDDAGDKFDIDINFSLSSGAVLFHSNLDFIEIEYDRSLRLKDGSLHFYLRSPAGSVIEVSGCSASTVIWDVTDASAPERVGFTLDGTTARFGTKDGSYREYVAFEPSKVAEAPVSAGKVSNQDIHSLPVPDMLIITPKEYQSQAERVAELHRRVDGMVVHVLTPEVLYNEFSCGTRDISAFRKAMKMWFDRGGDDRQIRYCLIMSRPTYDNKLLNDMVKRAGYPRIPIWQSPEGTTGTDSAYITHADSYSTDDIIGMLEDCEGKDFKIATETINVAVGRMPVKSLAEAKSSVDKLIKYVEEPEMGAWRNNVMLVADDGETDHLNDTDYSYGKLTADYSGASYSYDKLYLDAFILKPSGTNMYYMDMRDKFAAKMKEGIMFLSYVGHGHPTGLSNDGFMTWEDINSFSNRRLPFLYTATCEFAPWDEDELTGGEIVWLNPTSGFIGLISTSRTTYIAANGSLTRGMFYGMLGRDADGRRRRVGDILTYGKNNMITFEDNNKKKEKPDKSDFSGRNKLKFTIIGDPALQLPIPSADVIVDKINGQDIVGDVADAPVLPARGKAVVEGHIAKIDGSVDSEFNGTVELLLLDAEKVITTHGNNEGQELTYNDRSTRLFKCSAKVKDGLWSADVFIPMEIENNYSPALITLYAYSDAGVEANGHTDKLYVYGYDEDAPVDDEGPTIKRFTLNSDSFRDGSVIGSTPVVYAEVYDDSGINISAVGLGHTMTLVLDGKESISGVADYYVPYPDDSRGGNISYLMPRVEPGEHTLDLIVWDNAGNSSKASLNFVVGAHETTVIYDLTTDKNPASSSVVFMLTAEQPEPGTECIIDVFDLNGRRLWTNSTLVNFAGDANVQMKWDLRDASGRRVPRGIYLYRATVKNSKGIVDTATKKLAVTAQ